MVDGRLEVRTPPSTLGFAGLRLTRELDPNENVVWLPRGAFGRAHGEVLEWEARVERLNKLAIIVETRTVRVEATEFGLRITYRLLDESLDGAELELPAVAAGGAHRYRLDVLPEQPLQRLLVDGQEVWARPKPPWEWEVVRFGATRTGEEHGAALFVDDVRYTRLFRAE